MATIDLGTPLYYRGGKGGVSTLVGIDDVVNGAPVTRVARYTFQAPAPGASGISLSFTGAFQTGAGGEKIALRYFVGTDPDSHADAGAAYEYTGDLIMDANTLTFTAAADFRLLPGKTYYLWVFPAASTYGWYYWATSATMEVEGSAGAVTIYAGPLRKHYIPHINKGGP
jgi:hypothetical protein